MPSGDNLLSGSGQLAADILVVGGGIMGLWGAVKAAQEGLSVVLIDRGKTGSGASGGLMGAMFPWMPDRWDEKKQFQYDALVALPGELAILEAATGLSARFRRAGRIIPLPRAHLRAIALRHRADALKNWHQGDNRFFWHVDDRPPVANYLSPEFGEGGYVHDTLAARAEPRAVTALLRSWLDLQPAVRVIEDTALAVLDAPKGRAELASSDAAGGKACNIGFSHAFIAAGTDSFPILEGLMPPLPKPLGQGVKGQSALLRADLDPGLPVAFLDGLYVVPHADGHVAVGSTSENSFHEPFATDHLLETVLDKARALVPALRDAPVVERWAGLRPKAIGRDPLIGPLAGHPNIIALTGGFKISFGMAHRLAAAAVDYATMDTAKSRRPEGLPANFTLEGQVMREMNV